MSSNRPRVTTSPNHPNALAFAYRAIADRSVSRFDLLRALGFDPGAVATTRLDPAANSDPSASEAP